MANIRRPEFEPGERPEGFRSRRARIGYELGTELIGASLWELPAGEAAYPYHFHYSDEELVIVLSGRPSLRTPEGIRELEEGDVVSFPVGEDGAHQLLNRGEEQATFLAISSSGRPDVIVYPDSGKVGVGERLPKGGGLRGFFLQEDAVDYWTNEDAPSTDGQRRGELGCRAMSAIDELIANNDGFAAALPDKHLDVHPRRQLAIVTCMDSRLDVFAALGLRDGEAHVLRNAGGVITDDVIRSLAVSQRRLGTREVMLIHHTDCGMQKLTDDGFRTELMETTGVAPAFAIESFADVDADVHQSILRVRRSAFLPHRDLVRGFVYDVDTHRLREVDAGPDA